MESSYMDYFVSCGFLYADKYAISEKNLEKVFINKTEIQIRSIIHI